MNTSDCLDKASGGAAVGSLRVAVVLIALMALFLGACATVGHDFPVDRVPEIRIGETTQAEIRAMFGPPWRVGIEDGQPTWTYGKYRYKLFSDASTQDLVVRFDASAIVASYSFNTTEHKQ
jgi:hypothetical protein